ncbi:MAG: GNAT family N-acetyltransferase [Paraburkholderia sp.]|uniref:GNAT family N-acetyltransferase n=1 Tax=Paraburkholderia sp. TaxID=1926495 RepID=UPI0011FA0491|nr:GNAT family N-acetyltransferase [Paraburkholderia sp.]TAL97276.1 MAG: GNAT family N-acetyltransferase [Paraburkholderia sp.]
MFDFSPTKTDQASLSLYADLFKACFPSATHLGVNYLEWLYRANPAGEVVGFDAFSEGRLAGHYVCVPADVLVEGQSKRALLSLNTATHPDFQGRGLFTELAKRTYERGAGLGFDLVYGIANANSTPGFVRKLGFQLVCPLDARISIGKPLTIDWSRVARIASFRRIWDAPQFKWRCSNPTNRVFASESNGVLSAFARTNRRGIIVYGETSAVPGLDLSAQRTAPPLPRIFLGLIPESTAQRGISAEIPRAFRPSPLNFIHRPLNASVDDLSPGKISLSFLDFDAY